MEDRREIKQVVPPNDYASPSEDGNDRLDLMKNRFRDQDAYDAWSSEDFELRENFERDDVGEDPEYDRSMKWFWILILAVGFTFVWIIIEAVQSYLSKIS